MEAFCIFSINCVKKVKSSHRFKEPLNKVDEELERLLEPASFAYSL